MKKTLFLGFIILKSLCQNIAYPFDNYNADNKPYNK